MLPSDRTLCAHLAGSHLPMAFRSIIVALRALLTALDPSAVVPTAVLRETSALLSPMTRHRAHTARARFKIKESAPSLHPPSGAGQPEGRWRKRGRTFDLVPSVCLPSMGEGRVKTGSGVNRRGGIPPKGFFLGLRALSATCFCMLWHRRVGARRRILASRSRGKRYAVRPSVRRSLCADLSRHCILLGTDLIEI
jgi:hypothetical protein